MKIIQITDLHLYADPAAEHRGVNPWCTLLAVLEHIRRHHEEAALCLVTGDLVHDESAIGYRRLRARLESLGVPLRLLPGNHDDPSAIASIFSGRNARMLAPLRLSRWAILPLDSRVSGWDGGSIGPSELRRLDRLLKAPGPMYLLIALHHPPIAIGSPWLDAIGLENRAALMARLQVCDRVRGLVFGHAHQPLDERLHSLRLLGTPSTCIQFRPHTPAPQYLSTPPAYRWLVLRPDGEIETGIETI